MTYTQGSFCVCTQPMRDDVIMQHHFWLTGCIKTIVPVYWECAALTHWGQVMHIFVGNLTIISWDNGLSPGQHQAIISTNTGLSMIGPLGTNLSEIWIDISIVSFKKMCFKMSGKWQQFFIGLNVLYLQEIRTVKHTVLCVLLGFCSDRASPIPFRVALWAWPGWVKMIYVTLTNQWLGAGLQ